MQYRKQTLLKIIHCDVKLVAPALINEWKQELKYQKGDSLFSS